MQSMLSVYCTNKMRHSFCIKKMRQSHFTKKMCQSHLYLKIMGHSHLRRFCSLIFIIFYFRSENVEILDSSDSKSEQHISDNRSQGKLFSHFFWIIFLLPPANLKRKEQIKLRSWLLSPKQSHKNKTSFLILFNFRFNSAN